MVLNGKFFCSYFFLWWDGFHLFRKRSEWCRRSNATASRHKTPAGFVPGAWGKRPPTSSKMGTFCLACSVNPRPEKPDFGNGVAVAF